MKTTYGAVAVVAVTALLLAAAGSADAQGFGRHRGMGSGMGMGAGMGPGGTGTVTAEQVAEHHEFMEKRHAAIAQALRENPDARFGPGNCPLLSQTTKAPAASDVGGDVETAPPAGDKTR